MKNSKILLIVFLITFSFRVKGQVNFELDSTFFYKTKIEGKLKMNIFIPKKHKITNKRPVIIFFFGVGWVGDHPKQFYQQAKSFADKVFLAISAEYRVRSKHKTNPFECERMVNMPYVG